jgi:hypothetical protein
MVGAIDAAPAAVSIEEFKTGFAPAKMMKQEIYMGIWDRKEVDGSHDDLFEFFQIQKDFMAVAARNKMGIIVSMC